MYSQAVADTICARLAEGESLRSICKDAEMPDKATVMRWLNENEDFATKYAHAREAQADTIFDDMAAVEDKVESGELKPDAAKVILWSRQWRAEKLKPKAYGHKVETTIKGTGAKGEVLIASPQDESLL